LAAIGALAEEPNRFDKIFLTKKSNFAGCYAVKLFVNGEPQVVVVDDFFPFDERPEKDNWAFGSVKKEWSIYVNVLEKAIAKTVGSYEAIEGGKAYQAFSYLTGFPSDCLFHSELSTEELWILVQ
jgi:hypothetical protein